MFESARLKLTAQYLAIIMLVSLIFSGIIYTGINSGLKQLEQIDEIIMNYQRRGIPVPRRLLHSHVDQELTDAARARIITTLGVVNLVILGISGISGYFLAGRTLRPIKSMVDEQKRFVADASHELRTPLTSLRSEIEVTLRNKKMSILEAKKLLKSNLEEVISLQKLSDNLLELAQSGRPLNPATLTTVVLNECIESAIKKLNGTVTRKGNTIEKKVDSISVMGLPDRIRELFVILLDNAVKYSLENSTVTISAKKSDRIATITVADQGLGIPKEDLPFIFDRFYRANKSRCKTEVQGFGLGLSIAKKIVDIHNGSISVKSKVDNGTVFTITLPVK